MGRSSARYAYARTRALLLGAALCAACDAVPFGLDDGSATIQITVVRGPTQPVEREGQPAWEPVAGARIGARTAFGDVTRHAATNSWGAARLQVPAGAWVVAVETCPGALAPPPSRTVEVQAATFAAVRFECDTGIR